jgi:hypothetical protein
MSTDCSNIYIRIAHMYLLCIILLTLSVFPTLCPLPPLLPLRRLHSLSPSPPLSRSFSLSSIPLLLSSFYSSSPLSQPLISHPSPSLPPPYRITGSSLFQCAVDDNIFKREDLLILHSWTSADSEPIIDKVRVCVCVCFGHILLPPLPSPLTDPF